MRRIDYTQGPLAQLLRTAPYTLYTADGRVTVTVHPGLPAYAYVTHDGLTEGEVDATLLELSWHIPAPCCELFSRDT